MSGFSAVSGNVATDTPPSANSSSRILNLISQALTVCLCISAAFVSFFPLFGKLPWMLYEEDDFFYYLKIADNLAHGQGSTWNGLVPTNGYHPLWLALLAIQSRLFGSILALQIFLAIAIFASTLATYLLSRRLLQNTGANPLLTSALAAYIALYSMHLFNGGMEIILTIPLALAVALAFQSHAIWQPLFLPNFGFGLLVAALCLSRLDTAILIFLLFIATLAHPRLRAHLSTRQILFLLLGFSPVLLYLLSNHFYFHTWLPISGMAKELRLSHLPASPAWVSLFSKSRLQLLNVVVIVIAIALLPVLYRRLTATQQVLYPILLIFPFIYLFVLSCVSDWQLWDWYFYCLRVALCIAFVLLLTWQISRRVLNHIAVTAVITLVVFAQLISNRRHPTGAGGADLYAIAIAVRGFAATHPGVYAMGDRSGNVGYLLPYPVVQTEGLVMDRDFLTLVQQRRPLLQVLSRYNVRYYIATSETPYTGCFHAVEPIQAGKDSAHITADICTPPIASFPQNSRQTFIFDLSQADATPNSSLP